MKKILAITLGVCLFIGTVAYANSVMYENKIYSTKDVNISPVGGVIRQNNAGQWFVQNDVDHKSVGISSVGIVNNKLRVNYDITAKNVITLTMTPDDAMLKRGYVVAGASVGLSAADFSVGRIMSAYGGATYSEQYKSWVVAYNSPEYKISFEDRGNGTIRIYHGDNFDLIPTQLTARDGGYIPKLGIFDKDYFEVSFYKEDGEKVTRFDSKCNFLYTREGYREINIATEKFLESENFWINGMMDISQ
jgi:hypothetical protein